MQTVPHTLVNGKTTCNMGREPSVGRMDPSIRVITSPGKRKERVFSSGLTGAIMMVNSRTTTYPASVFMFGRMIEGTREHGRITRCMGKGSSHGPTVVATKVSILMTKSRATEFSNGMMALATPETGSTESVMVAVHIPTSRESSAKASGKTAIDSGGLMEERRRTIRRQPSRLNKRLPVFNRIIIVHNATLSVLQKPTHMISTVYGTTHLLMRLLLLL
jgi:hypothetical protein